MGSILKVRDSATGKWIDIPAIVGTKGENFNPHSFGLPVLELTGDVSTMTKDIAVDLDYVYGDKSGKCSVKWQGSSSLSYPKKNYTIKFNEKTEIVEAWGAQKKYCAKANYIDFSHARNVVNAKLWGQIVKSRKNADARLLALPNGGAVDGFPMIITINDEFQGLFTFNIPKDGWMMGMGDGEKEAIVCADYHVPATQFKAEADLATDFELEYNCDTFSEDEVKASLNTMLRAVANSDGSDIDSTVSKYLDIPSAIDYFIFVAMLGGDDMTDKNYLLGTYDGVKWFFTGYDMDSTYGMRWDGKEFRSPTYYPTIVGYKNVSKIMELIYRYKADALKQRYNELRATVFSENNMYTTFYNFASAIPEVVRMEDAKKWPLIPSTSVSNVDQILNWFKLRCVAIDAEVAPIVQEITPDGNILTPGTTYTDWELAHNGTNVPHLEVNAAEGYIRGQGNLDGTAVYLRTTKFKNTATAYNFSFEVSGETENGIAARRILFRCLDANGNVIKTAVEGFGYLDFYKAHYRDALGGTFTPPAGTDTIQFGFLMKAVDGKEKIKISNMKIIPVV